MEKTNCLLDVVRNQLQNAISNIDAGNSNLNEEQMEELIKTLSTLNKGVKRISKAYACEHILHCSPATFDNNDKDNEMFWCIMKDIHEELRGKHFDEVYATYQVDNMYHTDNKGNKIASPMFTPIDVRKLYDKKFKSINSNITFWDVYVALNAQYHDNIELYKEWFGEDNIENIKDKIIESAIVNWFEDEDAGIEKVWNYFRAI